MKRGLIVIAALAMLRCASFRTLSPTSPEVTRVTVADAKLIDVEGVKVRVADDCPDKSSPIVLLHGLGSSLETWNGWAETLCKEHRVIRIDLPGSGLTDLQDRPVYLPETDALVVKAVIDHFGIDHFSIAGNSLGGWAAWLIAGDSSTFNRVDALILISSIGLHDKSTFLDRAPKLVKKISALWTPRSIGAAGLRSAYGAYRRPTADEVNRYWTLARVGTNRAVVAGRLLSPFRDYTATLGKITARTLILWGGHDAASLADAKIFHDRIHSSMLVVLPQLGHLSMEEDPATTSGLVQQFLRNQKLTLPSDAKVWPTTH